MFRLRRFAIFSWLQIISRTTAATGDVDVGVDQPPLQASPVGPERWKAHRPMLAGAYQSWLFLDSRW